MSGDVQPRKRKDKKRKKDELGVEEPRGTAAVFGEGDVFMHSPHEHGTGGHWCAKVIFFSLLAILISLIGLIILENRGLTDLEANSVESRYAGVLEGWLEEAPDDDHHDEHTLELKHQDDEEDENDHGDELEHGDEDDHDDEKDDDDRSDEFENDNEDEDDTNNVEDNDDEGDNNDDEDDDDEHNQDDEDDNNNDEDDDDEHNHDDENNYKDDDDEEPSQYDDDNQIDDNSEELKKDANNKDEIQKYKYKKIFKREANEDDGNYNQDDGNKHEDEEEFEDNYSEEDNDHILEENDDAVNREDDNDEENDGDNHNEDDEFYQSIEDKDEDGNSKEFEQNDSEARDDEDDEEHDDEPEDVQIKMERIEKEVSEENDASSEVPSYVDIGEVDGQSQEDERDADGEVDGDIEEEEFLEPEDEELPEVERITVPAGKPFTEVEDETSSERPSDTLAEEEEYEKQQEELRREQEQASNLWLKLAVGCALLAATHAVVLRATAATDTTASHPDTATSDDHGSREETPSLIDRRMTLIMDEPPVPVVSKIVPRETSNPLDWDVVKKTPTVLKTLPPKQESEEEEEVETPTISKAKKNLEALKDKEIYSDDEDEEEEIVETKEEVPKKSETIKEKKPTPELEEPEDDDVEIIDDEQLEEELEEEDVEDEISDVDDAELLSRLEAKYGRLPEPERPGRKHKDGGNSIEDEWPGEPSDPYWREQLDRAEEQLRQGEWSSSLERAGGEGLTNSARARWVVARALDAGADARRDNKLLSRAIAAYLDLLKMNERLTDVQLRTVTERTLDRIQFRGNYLGAEPIYRLLIRRFPEEPGYRNNLTVSFLMANRADLAEEVLKETLKRWPNDRFALAHHGFVLKTQHNRLKEAVTAFEKALEGDTGPANEPRFYYHLGDALLLLGRFEEANKVHKRGAALGHFLSPAQRSLYNVNHLIGRPWWNIEDTPYIKLIRALEKSWKEILKEGEAASSVYEKEKEGLKERGEWSQLDLFVRGREIAGRCDKAPVTCSIVRAERAASGCTRGQIKFSSMEAGTHVRPHVGPTNCRLRMHLGLSNTKDTFIRVDKETRQWETGKVFIFDDSFEHEVWHNGTGTRLVLIVDVWHPDLTPAERRQLPAI